MCALFFIKKGFPFISVLDGGFAAAHAWLARDCDYLTLNQVLVDYDDKSSLFADLERSYQAQKEFSNASTRRKTGLALQKLMDNSMTRLTMLENRIEQFTERPRGREAMSQTETNDEDVETSESSKPNQNEIIQAFGSKAPKIPPMRLFGAGRHSDGANKEVDNDNNEVDKEQQKIGSDPMLDYKPKIPPMRLFGTGRHTDNASKTEGTTGVKGEEEKETKASPSREESHDADRHINVDAMKSGFNKAFSGLKKIRVPRVGKNSNDTSEVSNTDIQGNDKPSKPDNNQSDKKQNQGGGFKLGRLNFGNKKHNVFNRKVSQSKRDDDDLEKEIEASLTRPDKSESGKPMSTLQTKAKSDGEKPNEKKFVNPLKNLPLNKFGSINKKNKTATSIIHEEESLFFDDEENDEDTLSFQTDDNTDTSNDF